MFPHQGQDTNPTPDAARFFTGCIAEAGTKLDHPRVLESLSTWDLLWFVAINWAHAIEIAGRAFGVPPQPDPLARQALQVADNPTPDRLYAMWQSWRTQQPHLSDNETREVAIHLSLCRLKMYGGFCELVGRTRHLPVFSAWLDLIEPLDDTREDVRRGRRFFDAMDGVLERTVSLRLTREQRDEGSPVTEHESIAIAGASEMENRIREWLTNLLSQSGAVIADSSGLSIKVPEIPELPVIGMAGTSGTGAAWRSFARCVVVEEFLVWAVPGACEIFETALPDWAHAAQRDEHDRADAQKRGGIGGPKARRKAKEAQRKATEIIEHVRMRGTPNPESDAEVPRVLRIDHIDHDDINTETLMDDRPNPQLEAEAHEEEAEAQERARRAQCIAIDRWGESGRLMLEALGAGKTDKEAAKAAGITPPALSKRLKTMEKLLRSPGS